MQRHDDSKPLTNLLQAAHASTPPAADGGRRRFVRQITLGAAALGTLPLAACGGGDDDAPAVQFAHGVASGDPLADRVMLWTRVTPPADFSAEIPVQWEVASDAAFASIVARGELRTSAARDYTVKVDATGLKPATAYHYRFKAFEAISPTGRTRTLPTGSVAQVKLAVFSCANYPAGYFNVYADAARRGDLDATVHLGDYLYEYGQGGYASGNAAALSRLSQPANEILSLADYRTRHAQYRTDADLQALHAAAPMIAVWDDHEIANDTWMNGAENHQAAEGSFSARKAVALQAYHEWMPTRNAQPDVIYRSFAFGNLLALHMLDTRVVGRDAQVDYTAFFKPGGFDAAGFTAAVGNPARQLLGTAQTQWLQQQMAASSATWQVLGQQVLMGRMNIPAPILMETLQPGSGVTVSRYAAIVAKARTAPATLTPEEQAILAQPSIPYNLDAWDGYQAARETVLGMARAMNKNLVVLAGDTHNAWASELNDMNGNPVGVEFATSSVSSPGFEEYLPNENPATLSAALLQLVEPLKYCDTARRGYMVVTATATECRAQWVYVNTITSRQFTTSAETTLAVQAGTPGRLLKV
ncbi:alkaline phosphatase D family protein [Diaphorobacter sp. LR2014-1]|uniref:alkaline phosphatase D family protein n=1 Tax=Diaphorobacter sp. LR2014-1 TaxID=1933219 RepID=UPI000CDB2AC5|nr:alkaline phosphatase D family protein [Diaphorobacter sp. LR2014-1]POR12460.1 alkaline phosphatase [Diaphorobacter sp. LR2014-1]